MLDLWNFSLSLSFNSMIVFLYYSWSFSSFNHNSCPFLYSFSFLKVWICLSKIYRWTFALARAPLPLVKWMPPKKSLIANAISSSLLHIKEFLTCVVLEKAGLWGHIIEKKRAAFMRKKGTKKAHFNYFQGIKDVLLFFFSFSRGLFFTC